MTLTSRICWRQAQRSTYYIMTDNRNQTENIVRYCVIPMTRYSGHHHRHQPMADWLGWWVGNPRLDLEKMWVAWINSGRKLINILLSQYWAEFSVSTRPNFIPSPPLSSIVIQSDSPSMLTTIYFLYKYLFELRFFWNFQLYYFRTIFSKNDCRVAISTYYLSTSESHLIAVNC